jgi:hypothetical protein
MAQIEAQVLKLHEQGGDWIVDTEDRKDGAVLTGGRRFSSNDSARGVLVLVARRASDIRWRCRWLPVATPTTVEAGVSVASVHVAAVMVRWRVTAHSWEDFFLRWQGVAALGEVKGGAPAQAACRRTTPLLLPQPDPPPLFCAARAAWPWSGSVARASQLHRSHVLPPPPFLLCRVPCPTPGPLLFPRMRSKPECTDMVIYKLCTNDLGDMLTLTLKIEEDINFKEG